MFTLLKRLPLWLLILLSLAGYLLVLLVFPLLPHYNHLPLSDVRTFTPSLAGGLGYALLFLALYGLYLSAWQRVRQRGAALPLLLLVAALFALPLLFTYPINATDLFRYFVRARVFSVHGQSPLAVPPTAFPSDPFVELAGQWGDETSPYGPIWELTAAAVTIISGQSLLVSLLLFKLIGLLSHLGIGALLWQMLGQESPGRRAGLTLLWAWNPALLFSFVIDAHNDALMLFWLILGYWAIFWLKRPFLGFLLAFLAPLTKMVALLALPFYMLSHWRTLPTWAARLRFTLLSGVAALLLAIVAFLPFGSPLELVIRLIEESSGSAGFSFGVLLVLLAQRLDLPLRLEMVAPLSIILLLILLALLAWRTWQGKHPALAAAAAFGSYLYTALTFRIWYAAWPFPLLLLQRERRWPLYAGLWFLLTTQLSVVLYGHIRAFLLRGDYLVAHLIGVPFTFLLPLLLARAARNNPRSDRPQTEKSGY